MYYNKHISYLKGEIKNVEGVKMNINVLRSYMVMCDLNGIYPTWEGLNKYYVLVKGHKAA